MRACKQASLLLSMSHDRPLAWQERLSLGWHLVLCEGCRNFKRQLDHLRAIVRRYRDDDAR